MLGNATESFSTWNIKKQIQTCYWRLVNLHFFFLWDAEGMSGGLEDTLCGNWLGSHKLRQLEETIKCEIAVMRTCNTQGSTVNHTTPLPSRNGSMEKKYAPKQMEPLLWSEPRLKWQPEMESARIPIYSPQLLSSSAPSTATCVLQHPPVQIWMVMQPTRKESLEKTVTVKKELGVTIVAEFYAMQKN